MSNMCEVSINIDMKDKDKSSSSYLGDIVNSFPDAIPPGDDASIIVEESDTGDGWCSIHGYARWSLGFEQAIQLIRYLTKQFSLDLSKADIDIRYLERGFYVCGRYLLQGGILRVGDVDESTMKSIEQQYNMSLAHGASDMDWDAYWDNIYNLQENVELRCIYDFIRDDIMDGSAK